MADRVSVRRLSICASLSTYVMLTWAIVLAQAPNGGGPGPVLGIVEIPEMFFVDPNSGQYAPRAALRLYIHPNSDSKALPDISSPAAIDDAAYAHEGTGALVYGRKGGYFLIRSSRGVGWLSPHNAGSFHPLEDLVSGDLTYLTEAWDGFVSGSPGSAARTRVPQRRPNGSEDARVKGFRTLHGKLWVEVEVISHSFCESDKPPTIKARGWTTAHDKTGAPTVWFAAGGC